MIAKKRRLFCRFLPLLTSPHIQNDDLGKKGHVIIIITMYYFFVYIGLMYVYSFAC